MSKASVYMPFFIWWQTISFLRILSHLWRFDICRSPYKNNLNSLLQNMFFFHKWKECISFSFSLLISIFFCLYFHRLLVLLINTLGWLKSTYNLKNEKENLTFYTQSNLRLPSFPHSWGYSFLLSSHATDKLYRETLDMK